MIYKLEDYVVNAEKLSMDEVYTWSILGNLYDGTVQDFIESTIDFGVTYSFVCNNCGKVCTKGVNSILRGGLLCAPCARAVGRQKKKLEKGLSLYNCHPVVAEWFDNAGNDVSSRDVYFNSQDKYLFKCPKCGVIYKKALNLVVNSYVKHNSNGCRVCAGYQVLEGFNDITARNKPSAEYWDEEKNGIPSNRVLWSDQNSRWFRCPEGHSYQRTPFRMLNSYNKGIDGKDLCPICKGTEVLKGYNDIASMNPLALRYWDYNKNGDNTPETVYYRSHVQYWFRCGEGHSFLKRPNEFYLQLNNVGMSAEGCPVCSGNRLLIGFNDLETMFKELVDSYWDFSRNKKKPNEVLAYARTDYWWKCVKCGKSFLICNGKRVQGLGLCEDCRVIKSISNFETEVYNEVKKLYPNAKSQVQFDGMTYDIYVPDRKLVIECNGVYWHSDAVSRYTDGNHNKKRLNTLRKNGLSLFVIWEDQWATNKDLVLKVLKRKLGKSTEKKVNARDCSVSEQGIGSGVIQNNHIQGDVGVGCRYVSLKLNGYSVAEIAYKLDENGLYICRYATNSLVRGGFSKLLKYLIDTVCDNGCCIYAFSDNSISDGNLYRVCGFEKVDELASDYMYVYKNVRYVKDDFRKDRFKKDPKLKYVIGMTKEDLVKLNKIYRVYDYGKVKWQLVVEK